MTIKQTPQMALMQKLRQEAQNDQVVWFSYPDRTRKAKQAPVRSFLSSWIILHIIFFSCMAFVVLVISLMYPINFLFPLIDGAIVGIAVIVLIVLVVLRGQTAQRRLRGTLYAITTRRLLVITLDRNQCVQNSYHPSDLGRIDLVERSDGWGDVVIGGQQFIQSRGFSLAVVSPQLSGVAKAREVASLLARLKIEQRLVAP